MAQFVKRIRTDLNKTLETYNIGTLVTDDENSRKIYVDLYDNGAEVSASGTVTCIAKLHNNVKYAFSGTIESGKPYAVVPKAACSVPGPVTIFIRLTEGDAKTTIGLCRGYAIDASDPEVIAEEETTVTIEDLIENLDDLLAAIEEADAVTKILGCVAVVETTSSASIPYRKGEYLIRDGALYITTEDINEGGTITLTGNGQNCAPTKISDEICSLKDEVAIIHDIIFGNQSKSVSWIQGRYDDEKADFSINTFPYYVTTRAIGNVGGKTIKIKCADGYLIHQIELWANYHGATMPQSQEYEYNIPLSVQYLAVCIRKADYSNLNASEITSSIVDIKWDSVLENSAGIVDDGAGIIVVLR